MQIENILIISIRKFSKFFALQTTLKRREIFQELVNKALMK